MEVCPTFLKQNSTVCITLGKPLILVNLLRDKQMSDAKLENKMPDMTEAVNNAFTAMVNSGKLEAIITDKLEESVASAVSNALHSHSDFGNQLKQHIKSAISVDFKNLGIAGYNDFIAKVIKKKMDECLNKEAKKLIEGEISRLLQPAPASIKLSELIAAFREDNQEEANDHQWDSFTVNIGESRYGSITVEFDKEPCKDEYKCDVRFCVQEKECRIFALKVDEVDYEKQMFLGSLRGFDLFIFQLYASGTNLIIDVDRGYIDCGYEGYD
jgi:hypothetical protein